MASVPSDEVVDILQGSPVDQLNICGLELLVDE
ncbi:hypothetical protein FOXG_21375 [Fusarium oxysporum f. sp. lycopersici 4287]|uniref:Uncharacterized protein n=1 Tax=Fusarium oxysporum f. sp. lycopersici (strain 4287 / CBS 123668 / FGSC 9935 / NRRL 34936) TaxID=426428 RepID=A0A0J9VSH0_FUSO4|nr:hypothetical protein FOXG_20927 [Fusarium oxysporum f. sp. lycopersici 4287]XP_018253597.1 hypothetical protein FOXG_21375 [Fusarium oxysporum f. sp. lycopersici 4287]EWZ79210.1 hypothetical protein FOWG_16654 [Fusarium oxysporum f. sp. lycopersici MN25]KNB13798.1 hypothetical protein FOXG_20927 [Fusarium oxysporum f. sp. lycopersici 4287]KNB15552.1 hypothetical protein FOXG_21375 [Fusarium oxysporum f. sp. lycopersici 4287]